MSTYHKDFDFNFDFGPEFENFIEGAKEAAREFGERLREMGCGTPTSEFDPLRHDPCCGGRSTEPRDRAPLYSYPPANIYKDSQGAFVLQFALAGAEESSISVTFQGDYLVLSAKAPEPSGGEELRYERRAFRPRDVDRQKYFVPAEEYDQAEARAVFKNGVLTVTVPSKNVADADAIRIDIVKEGN
jgi:HSP20 family molecular chaperone IbpA